MWKLVVVGATAFAITSAQLAQAQAPAPTPTPAPAPAPTPYGQAPYAPYGQGPYAGDPGQPPSDTDFKSFTDRRLEIVKAALQLTPEQEKLWPPVEEAIRARSMARFARWQNVARRFHEQGGDTSPVDRLRRRADVLSERAAGMRKLADAWQPLYESLNPSQKQRLGFLAVYVLREMRDLLQSRRMQYDDDDTSYYYEDQ